MECLLQTNPIGSPGAGLSLSMSKSSVPLSSRLQFSQQEGLYGVAGELYRICPSPRADLTCTSIAFLMYRCPKGYSSAPFLS
ncbi:hypothetical protein PISMIDRAFT_530520 [Pisolithus microcarpus 441]|uniref:Uncharacterized protein n=1 Tax=Pisolithus microcarpus 441 TaxID=765257 RepID=A0A0C9ZHV1_9AGAM|nr:hypothetical protein PISMIDRAFT_530520 [Pisolithus microcarpus 441]